MAIHKMIKYHFVRSVIKNVHTRISQWRGEPIKRSLMRENPSSDILKKQSQYTDSVFKWRRNRDSNPRYARTHDGFQDRSNQPLWHSSISIQLAYLLMLSQTYLIVK